MSSAGESSKLPIPPSMTTASTAPLITSPLFKPSPFLDRLCKWLSSLVGTDQLIMLIQYSLDIITHHMNVHTFSRVLSIIKRIIPLTHAVLPTSLPASSPSPLSTRL